MFQKSYIPAAYLHPVLYFLNTSFDSVSDFLYAFLDCVARSLDRRLDRFAYFLGGNSVRYSRQKFFFLPITWTPALIVLPTFLAPLLTF